MWWRLWTVEVRGGVLDFRGKEGGRSWWIRWKEADELKGFGVGASASNAVILGNGLVDGSGDVEKPSIANL